MPDLKVILPKETLFDKFGLASTALIVFDILNTENFDLLHILDPYEQDVLFSKCPLIFQIIVLPTFPLFIGLFNVVSDIANILISSL